jgi:broad specificity phosphatase PhoE
MGNQADRTARPALILVKHGKPAIEPDRPRSLWALSEEGRAAAVSLAEKLTAYSPGALFSSPEIKAADTARAMGEVLGLGVRIDTDLGEHRADEKPFVSAAEFEANVARLFAEPDTLVMGEETGASARTRFAAAMGRVVSGGAETRIVVAHGRIITLWLSQRKGFEPLPFWKSLGLAHAVLIPADGGPLDLIAP